MDIKRRNFNKLMLASSIAGIMSGLQISTASAEPTMLAEKNACKGMNACKGQGGCKTGDNGCAGKDSCKGHGGCKVPVEHA